MHAESIRTAKMETNTKEVMSQEHKKKASWVVSSHEHVSDSIENSERRC